MANYDDFLMHYGIKGQKWGVRKYQNEDNTLTEEGRRHYGIGDGTIRKAGRLYQAGQGLRKSINKAVTNVADRTKSKVSEVRGPKHMSDAELNERVKRLRTEAEYARLKRELEGGGQNGGGGKKGDKKHPYLSKAIAMPVATAIGVGVGAIAKEKVSAFLDNRATMKMKNLLETAKTSTSTSQLNRIIDATKRALETAGRSGDGIPSAQSIVSANLTRQAATQAVKIAKKGRDFLNRTPAVKRTLTNYIPHNRGKGWRMIVNT